MCTRIVYYRDAHQLGPLLCLVKLQHQRTIRTIYKLKLRRKIKILFLDILSDLLKEIVRNKLLKLLKKMRCH